MSRPLVLLRPQPGNDRSAGRARAMGIEVIQLPLFEIVPVARDAAPPGPFDALLVTSANGARFGADLLARFAHLPLFAVGEASARAARDHDGRDVRTGGGDAASTVPLIVAGGFRHVLHVCGADVRPFDAAGLSITRLPVYSSEPRDMRPLTRALATLPSSLIAVHSPRAGRRLNALLPPSHRNHMILAISQAAARDCGDGWRRIHVSPAPDDTALLDMAGRLCMSAT